MCCEDALVRANAMASWICRHLMLATQDHTRRYSTDVCVVTNRDARSWTITLPHYKQRDTMQYTVYYVTISVKSTCRLDYCNALLAEAADIQMKRPQSLQTTTARLMLRTRRRDHITPTLRCLHWLPVRQRVTFKSLCGTTSMALLVHIYGNSACQWEISKIVQSYGLHLLHGCINFPTATVTDCRHQPDGSVSCPVSPPTAWNSLPSALRDNSLSLKSLKEKLKRIVLDSVSD